MLFFGLLFLALSVVIFLYLGTTVGVICGIASGVLIVFGLMAKGGGSSTPRGPESQ